MYCQKCGQKLPDDAKFCPNCGTDVKKVNNSKSSGIDANEIVDSSLNVIKSGAIDFKDKWSNWSSGKKFLSLIVCCCIGWIIISSVMGGLTPDKNSELFDSSNEGKNISLIKESTSGYAFYSSNKTVYDYSLSGVLINIPKDSKGFTVRGTFYDNGNKVIKESETDLDHFSYYTEKSDPTSIASIQRYEFVNVSKVQLTITDPNGEVVFNETYDYDMDKFDLSRLDEKHEPNDDNSTTDSSSKQDTTSTSTSSSSDSSSSSSSSSSSGGTYVASSKSNKFHNPSCSSAKRIKDSNRIIFSSRDEAISAGYSPCAVCSP